MCSNELISKYCPNYYKITEFEFFGEDYMSQRIVSFYQKYICNIENFNDEELKKASKIDKIFAKYIDDYSFRKEMKKELLHVKSSVTNVLKVIIDNIIKIFDNYEISSTRKIFISRWI